MPQIPYRYIAFTPNDLVKVIDKENHIVDYDIIALLPFDEPQHRLVNTYEAIIHSNEHVPIDTVTMNDELIASIIDEAENEVTAEYVFDDDL